MWLVTGGGALFAAFPDTYATAFSGFYLPFMILLFALIFRAVAIEFRSKEPMGWWRGMWDVAFSIASIAASLLFGIAVGNMILGIPVDADKVYIGGFFNLLNPYALLVGLFNLSIFVMHGNVYLYMKTEGELQNKVKEWILYTLPFFIILYVFSTIVTLVKVPSMIHNFEQYPWAWAVVFVNVLAVANIPREIYFGRPFRAFLSSAVSIAALLSLFAIGIYPNLIVSSLDAAYNLTIYNSSSSQKTLGIMLTMAVIGIPFVLTYTASIYWVFRGKVKLDKASY